MRACPGGERGNIYSLGSVLQWSEVALWGINSHMRHKLLGCASVGAKWVPVGVLSWCQRSPREEMKRHIFRSEVGCCQVALCEADESLHGARHHRHGWNKRWRPREFETMPPYKKDARLLGSARKKVCDELVMSAVGMRMEVSPSLLLFPTTPLGDKNQFSFYILEKYGIS